LPIEYGALENKSLNKKLGKAAFRRQAEEILGILRSEYDPFKNDTPEEQKRRKHRALSDPFFFLRTYLPHYCPNKFAPFHYELVAALERRPTLGDSAVVLPVARVAPRDFAKTTITSFGYVLHQICFKLRHFIVLTSDTQDLASDLTGYIYLELCFNERIKHDFGKLVRDNWAVEAFTTLNDVRILSRGKGQRFRGIKHKQHRPDLIILDDLENDASARNPKRCDDLLRWIKGTVYNAIDPRGNLFIVGTLLSQKSALASIALSKDEPFCHWDRKVYRAITDENESLWPDKFPMEMLEEQRLMMGTVAFNREKMNFPEQEGGYFRDEWFQYYTVDDLIDVDGKPKELLVCCWFDPSLETGSQHDFKAYVTVGYSQAENIFYCLDAYIKQVSLEIAVQLSLSLHLIYKFLVLGVESNLFQRLLIKEFDAVAKKAGVPLPVQGIVNHLNKEVRVAGLSPLVERGQIKFRKGHSDQDLLVEQLSFFPNKSFHDDGPDALEGAVRLATSFALPIIDVVVLPDRRSYRPGAYKEYTSFDGVAQGVIH
jgi:predicted phage terminase large subunit-like protein